MQADLLPRGGELAFAERVTLRRLEEEVPPRRGLVPCFRSHGGPDDPWNLGTLCAFHHLRGVHRRRIRITGRAPDGLVFELPIGRYASGDVKMEA